MKTTAGATNATVMATGPGSVDYHPSTDISNSDLKVVIPTASENLEPISNNDELIEVTEIYYENFEYEVRKLENIKGNLKRNISFWRTIGTSRFILDVIEQGYKLPFRNLPETVHFRNNKSADKHADFVSNAISELLNSGRVIQVQRTPIVISPLSVAVQPCGKKRLILDLRYVNSCLSRKKVKYEDWKIALAYFEKNAFMFSFDLKSGYHHIDIYDVHQTYLGFSWRWPGSQCDTFYVFTVLPFGLSTAPYIFTKLLKPLEKHWRYIGIKIAIFLDDGWSLHENIKICESNANTVRNDLIRAGFVPNDDKSIWKPTQSLDWLGLRWNSVKGSLSIVPRRIEKILNTIKQVIESAFQISARQLASLVGQIISTGPVVGNIARIMTRHCSMSIASTPTWDTAFQLDDYCKREIYFWSDNLSHFNERDCFFYKAPSFFVYSDASQTGCGSIITMNDSLLCHKMWLPHESVQSSTWRELAAIEFAILSFTELLKGSHVKWFTDNQTAAKIVEVGSMHSELQKIAVRIFTICLNNAIKLDIQWIPRDLNTKADYVSRLIDLDDWEISNTWFKYLNSLWGPHTIDCFANYYNNKLPRFFSRFWNPNSSGIDFFVQNLANENCWAVPPVSLVAQALHYMWHQKATTTIVVPFWPSANFWPIIMSKFREFVVNYETIDGQQALKQGRNKNSIFGTDKFYGQMIAFRMNFKK